MCACACECVQSVRAKQDQKWCVCVCVCVLVGEMGKGLERGSDNKPPMRRKLTDLDEHQHGSMHQSPLSVNTEHISS